jgi:hypothetical protein
VTVELSNEAIVLSGHCPMEDAEPLLQALLSAPESAVDWSACEGAHSAVLQLLLMSGRELKGVPREDFLRHWFAPMLQNPRKSS